MKEEQMSDSSVNKASGFFRLAFDVPIVLFILSAIAVPIYLSTLDDSIANMPIMHWLDMSFGIVGNLYLLVWITIGKGTRSSLWSWCPPFWPWGKYFQSSESRIVIIIIILMGSVAGFLSMIGVL